MEDTHHRRSDLAIAVPKWAVGIIVMLIVQIVIFVFGYGGLRQQVEDLDRDVQQIKLHLKVQ